MAKHRMEFDAIVVVKADTVAEGEALAKEVIELVERRTAVEQVGGAGFGDRPGSVLLVNGDQAPTVLTLADPNDIDSIDGELRDYEVRELPE